MEKIRLIRTGTERGDCTAPYDVVLDKQYTVKGFIETILSARTDEWGYIGIKSNKEQFFGCPVCEYSYGKLTTEPMPEKTLSRKVKLVEASGGWTRMDYLITL